MHDIENTARDGILEITVSVDRIGPIDIGKFHVGAAVERGRNRHAHKARRVNFVFFGVVAEKRHIGLNDIMDRLDSRRRQAFNA